MGIDNARAARLIALLLPLGLLGGALGSQYIGGLYPCEMCYWQRWPHGAAVVLALLAFTGAATSKRSGDISPMIERACSPISRNARTFNRNTAVSQTAKLWILTRGAVARLA